MVLAHPFQAALYVEAPRLGVGRGKDRQHPIVEGQSFEVAAALFPSHLFKPDAVEVDDLDPYAFGG